MSTADEIIVARRARIIEVVDARCRIIGVRRILPSEQLYAIEAAEDGEALIALLCAAAVTFIEQDGVRRVTPGHIREPVLRSLIGTLGADGLAAVAYAVWQHAAPPAGGQPSFDPFRPLPLVAASHLDRMEVSAPNTLCRIGALTFAVEAVLPSFLPSVRS